MIYKKRKLPRGNVFFLIILLFFTKEVLLTGEVKTLSFSGYTWVIKDSGNKRVAPGPNFYSSDQNSVYIDERNQLHMSIISHEDRWICSEVFTREKLGYGTYKIELLCSLSYLDPQMVLGLFTYDLKNRLDHQEIDIEISRWGDESLPPGNYTVQPYEVMGNTKSFHISNKTLETTHLFIWEKDKITFESYHGHGELSRENLIQSWIYRGNYIPIPQKPSFRINFWLFKGKAPDNPGEIIIKKFNFEPLTQY